jgi:RNA polymerase sigma-70 factor (ECF subfamily)
MESASGSRTSVTLLGRLRQDPADQAAWATFVARYGPKIHAWCRRWNLPDVDAEDVTQDVLTLLAQKLRTFTYDRSRSFRGWLRKLTQHALSDYVTSRQRAGQGSGDSHVDALLHTVAARDDLVTQLKEEFDYELLEEAMARVQLRVERHTWEAFRLTAQEGLTAAAAAAQLQLPVTTVFKAKNRVKTMLQDELSKLEEPRP